MMSSLIEQRGRSAKGPAEGNCYERSVEHEPVGGCFFELGSCLLVGS